MNRFIRSRHVVTPDGTIDALLRLEEGQIGAVIPARDIPQGLAYEDAGDRFIMPGLVDSHVHINEPGRTSWEGFESATRSAAAGGITTLVDMPLNSSPVTVTAAAYREKAACARGKLRVDVGFYGGLVPGNAGEMGALADEGVLGVKAFLIDSGIAEFPAAAERDLRAAMPVLAARNLPLLVHCELDTTAAPSMRHPGRYADYLASRPRAWEHDAIDLVISLCREYRCATHIVHLSSADAVRTIMDARAEGLPLTVETCPHYLAFSAEEIADGDTRFKCAPPIREAENRERLWDALRSGVIDAVVSDHSPAPPSLKCVDSGDFGSAWGGIASLQFGLPIVWTEARKRGFRVDDIARWMSSRPARLARLDGRKGAIAPGFDADLVVWNPDAAFTVRPESIHHRHRLTPYEGMTLFGTVETTFLRGTPVYERGAFPGAPGGSLLRHEAAAEAGIRRGTLA